MTAVSSKISALTQVGSVTAGTEFIAVTSGASPSSKKMTAGDITAYMFKQISGISGAAGKYVTVQKLSSDSSTVSTTTLGSSVMTTTGLGAGTWRYRYAIAYQTAATTTGIAFGINHTGTATILQQLWTQVTIGAGTADSTGDDVAATNAGQLAGVQSGVTINAIIGAATVGVATANANILAILEGILVVTVSGDLELKIASEVNASNVKIMANSCLELIKVA